MWHLEVESLLVLKNNRGVEDNRVRHMDYSVQINKTLYNRLIKGQSITLFSPSDVDGLYDAFFEDQELFEKLYTKYEKDPSIRKSELKATELFSMLMQERASTGTYLCAERRPLQHTWLFYRKRSTYSYVKFPRSPNSNKAVERCK